jgi:hypothetical protein
MKQINSSDRLIKIIAESDKWKEVIYKLLLTESLSRKVCCDRLNLTKNQLKHHTEYLIKNKHVKATKGPCKIYNGIRVDILQSNINHPFIAKSFDEIKAEKLAEIAKQKIVNKHLTVYNLLDRKEHNHVKLSDKSYRPNLQSSFNNI